MTLETLLASVIITIVPLGGSLMNGDICGGDILGVYSEGEINICESEEDTDFYLFHELGHHLYSKLTQKQKDEYTRVYKLAKIRGINAFLRDYGYNDVEESFADDFSLLITQERVNIHIKKRQKIIRQFIKSL